MDTDPGPTLREPPADAPPAPPSTSPSTPSAATLTLRRRLHGRPARRRELCLWLGAVASWRQGLVKRLVKEYGSVGRALDRNADELRSVIGRPGYRPRRAGQVGRAEDEGLTGERGLARKREAHAAERSEEEARLAAVLAADPARYAAAGAVPATGPASTRAAVAWCDPLYPPALRQLSDPPLCLFVRAECTEEELVRRLQVLCSAAAVAVVGTRSPSPYGHDMATVLGRDLTRSGLVVVSGLAMGIDAAAQAAALGAAGPGTELATVGVLGCGADVIYPRQNTDLFRAVGRRGLLVSEFVWGVPARPWRFPARNRVMAALARGVVIVEGAARSGARLTADYALDLGREVLAVPGEAGRRLTAAPHEFLRDGATLCESAADVTAATAAVLLPEADELAGDVDPAIVASLLQRSRGPAGPLAAVAEALARAPMTIDQVAGACGLAVQDAAALLSELEVDGLVRVTDGGVYRLRA